MKLAKLIIAASLFVVSVSANDVLQNSMSTMEKGMTQIQKGFLNNNLDLIKEGTKLVKEGNILFSDAKVINQYLPDNKKHMVNVAENASKRISLDITELEANLDNKAFIKAANSYSDMLNACSSCHSIVRNW
ncbi:hypothetical protein AVENP_2731 [Arcobacter venerupis]|uniref:Cytochrome C n=1 Tax=Arcobacter venerupis TaxID=1054033 RepID=A0AAE7E5L7_9BACT|nr:hypothetical protein [Arcobacter venerupis]QKF68212.1 hypothetical protein AVENP_2731 [Arcobacter venerupis]RWS48596.1 hypothetical protein CKA56_13265 [Arcobacter venerupis]